MSEHREPLCLSPWDYIGCGALASLLVAWKILADRLPARVPTHFDMAGNANGWTDRSALPWLVFGLPVGTWLVFWLLDLAMLGADVQDERIWIPKRIGIGWTLNFGRPAGWLTLLLSPLALVMLMR